MTALDPDKLHGLVIKTLGDLGGAMSIPTVRIGMRLGLFKALADAPGTPAEIATRLGLSERYVREWAFAQAANGYATHDAASGRFHLTPEQAHIFAIPDSPAFLAPAFDMAAAMVEAEPKVEHAFRTGEGVAWGDSAGCLFCAVGAFFRPGYVNNIVQAWLPALEGVCAKLETGGVVADIGCGVGFSTLMMAEAFPNSRFIGYDFHGPSIAQARAHAEAHGVGERVRFEVSTAKEAPGQDFDLITMFDCLHDMGDPRGAARHIHSMMRPDGAWMIVEPLAADRPEDNLPSPVSRIYYNASTMICVPTSLSQEVGEALGAQAGEAVISQIVREAGFSRVRRAAETATNMILEARP